METMEIEFIGQVDNYLAWKDYQRGGRCIRFIAVKKESLEFFANDDGICTYTVDISYWELSLEIKKHVKYALNDGGENNSWFYIKGEVGKRKNSGYFYKTFGRDEPEYFSLQQCKMITSPPIINKNIENERNTEFAVEVDISSSLSFENYKTGNSRWDFYSFHVGQGMCSLITNGKDGILLDVGAGKPILRGDYLKNDYGYIKNHLWDMLAELNNVRVIISHPDSDHWRMLAWDVRISNKVSSIFIPHNTKKIIWKDITINNKVTNVSGSIYFYGGDFELFVLRSFPSKKTDNTDCLVSLFKNHDGEKILQSGDYVYSDMKNDLCPFIRHLSILSYDAVVVPHHGDAASANAIFKPLGHSAKAFFSAGNHTGYGHPTKTSLDNHKAIGYNEICDNTLTLIKSVKLSN
ncbi:ComEC/Rec2 family competence protein [Enterobacter bugandensis]